MKKYFILIAALATTMTTVTSCINDEEKTNDAKAPAEIKIAASLKAPETQTRAAYNLQGDELDDFANIGIYAWYTGCTAPKNDAPAYAGYNNIKVSDATPDGTSGNYSYTLTPTIPATSNKMYFPTNNANVDVYLYAPYNASPTQTNMVMNFAVQTNQVEKSDYIASDFLWGKVTAVYASTPAAATDKTASVTMAHALTKIIFKVVPATGIDVSGMTNITLKTVNTATTVNLGTGETTDATTSNNITVWTSTAGTNTVSLADTQTTGVACIIPSQSITASTTQISVAISGITKDVYLPAATLGAAKVYTYNLNILGADLGLELAGITDWVSGGDPTNVNITF